MTAVLIVFLVANKKKESLQKQYQNETATRHRQDSVPVRDAIARKIYTQKNKTRRGNQQDREDRGTEVTTERNTGT